MSSMLFCGKWSFQQGENYVQIDSSGTLKIAAKPTDGSENFNAYGTDSNFVLQAGNGKYVVSSSNSYVASKERTDPLNHFKVASGKVVDLGLQGTASTEYYWDNHSGAIQPLKKNGAPPATTDFKQTVVTIGLSKILAGDPLGPKPDLTWVYLQGTDFSQATGILDFTEATLTNANFSKATFSDNTGFQSATGHYANFSDAKLPSVQMGNAKFMHADFSNATMGGASLENSCFNNATMNGVVLTGSSIIISNTKFKGTKLQKAKFTNAGTITQTDFTGADLTGADFTGSMITGTGDLQVIIEDATMTGVIMNNPKQGSKVVYPNVLRLNSKTNFTRAQIRYLDFTGYDLSQVVFTHADMTGCALDKTKLMNAEMSYATLDGATFTGTVSLQGANLSNASLQGADLTKAQLGAFALVFSVASGTSNYNDFLDGLKNDKVAEVATAFKAAGHPLSGTITIQASQYAPSSNWTVTVTVPQPITYTVVKERIDGRESLDVYTPTGPANLTNAVLVNTVLTGANLIGVPASGAQLYSFGGKTTGLNKALMRDMQLSNANLGHADLSSANLEGVNFDYSILTGVNFQHATLTTSGAGGRCSFSGSNLTGADFDGATLQNVYFVNAAIGVEDPNASSTLAGVWLFSISPSQAGLLTQELNAASPDPDAGPNDPRHQFTLPLELLQLLTAPGPVKAGIKAGFQDANITLSSKAILTINSEAVFWKLTDGSDKYVVFQDCNDNFQPALGVASGTEYTAEADFFLPLYLKSGSNPEDYASVENHLNNGPADKVIHEAFTKAGHPIGATATIAVAQHPVEWQVVDGSTLYSIWLGLQSSRQGCEIVITVRPAISNLINAFYNFSIAVSRRATVTRIASGGWALSNDADNPFNPVKNYIGYNILKNTSGGLDVYGAILRILRLASGQEQYFNIPASKTTITQTQMEGGGNVCPNGAFATTNKTNGLPFDEWLRARVPPRPPRCVPDPDGMFNCPT